MNTEKHGFSIGMERIHDESIIVLSAFGLLTHEDYEHFSPMLESAIQEAPGSRVNMLVDISSLRGWELRAAWDDLKLGLKHGSSLNKIALLGNKNWQDIAAKVGGWFMSGDMKSFTDISEAKEWLAD